MNFAATHSEITINKSQILDALASHLIGLGYAKGRDIVDLQIEGLVKDMVPIKFKTQEVNTGRPLQ